MAKTIRARNITVVGAGYVGLVNAVCLADLGHRIVCLDIDMAKVERLSAGKVDIEEPGLTELLAKTAKAGRIRFESDPGIALKNAEIAMVCVDTPVLPGQKPNLTSLMAAIGSVAEDGSDVTTVVLRSTVPPGTCLAVNKRLAEIIGNGRMAVVSHPEFFQEGSAVSDCQNPVRIVVGSRDKAAAAGVADLWGRDDVPVVSTDLETAEMIKQASNGFLAAKISFINDIARICDIVGADVDTVAAGMGLDPRIGNAYLRAGVGFGGSCLPKDLRALISSAQFAGWNPKTLVAALDVNDQQRDLVVERLKEKIGDLNGRRIGLLGLTFKPGTSDLRDSPAIAIAESLLEAGAIVVATDPIIPALARDIPDGVTLADDPYEAAVGASALVMATEWSDFLALDWSKLAASMDGKVVLDGRNSLERADVEAAGLIYMGVGRGRPEIETGG